jgi:hypothetical protein
MLQIKRQARNQERVQAFGHRDRLGALENSSGQAVIASSRTQSPPRSRAWPVTCPSSASWTYTGRRSRPGDRRPAACRALEKKEENKNYIVCMFQLAIRHRERWPHS